MTSIGKSVVIRGEVTSSEDLLIEGDVHGHVLLRDATVTIGESARVEGDVRAKAVRVLGTVIGNVSSTARIEVGAAARIEGSLSANQIVMADGARFNGRIDMDRRTIAVKVAAFKAASA